MTESRTASAIEAETLIEHIAAYRFVAVDDPAALADGLRASAEAKALRGTVLVAPEGLNLFLAGAPEAIAAFLAGLRADPRFADLVVRATRCAAMPFARLKVKVKAEIIAFRQDDASPLATRAPAVAPATLARWIAPCNGDTTWSPTGTWTPGDWRTGTASPIRRSCRPTAMR